MNLAGRRIIRDDDDDEEEWNPHSFVKSTTDSKIDTATPKKSSTPPSEDESDDGTDYSLVDSDEDEYKNKKSKKRSPKSQLVTPAKKVANLKSNTSTPILSTPLSQASNATSVETAFTPDVNLSNLPEGVGNIGSHEHNKWEWLKPANIKDKFGRRPDHPDYNPRTVLVPTHVLNAQTPGMRQWFEFKMNNMDTVLFFKVC